MPNEIGCLRVKLMSFAWKGTLSTRNKNICSLLHHSSLLTAVWSNTGFTDMINRLVPAKESKVRWICWKFTLSKPQTLKTQEPFDFALTLIASNQVRLVSTSQMEKGSDRDRKKRNRQGLGILGSHSHPSCK